ncbi:30S ribosomal protein S16 [Circinella umbellata]|nr:30S ribosomal protein S16 [Circinella umbellata]
MVVRMRLARFGRRNLPYYHIVVANARTARNSKPIEKVGTYNPIPDEAGNKVVNLNFDRVKYWLTVGAQPSDTVEKLLVKANIVPQAPKPWMKEAAKRFESSSTPQ